MILKLRESGGRTIERTVTLPVDLKTPRIGIKPLFANNQAAEGEPARFEAIVLGADGKAVDAKGLKWELLRLDQRWQWYSRDGSWNYEPVTQHAPRRHRHGRRRTPARPPRSRPRSTGAATASRCRSADGADLQHGVQCRLVRRRGRRQPRGARRRARQAGLQGGRHRARQDHHAHGRPRADRGHRAPALPPRRRSTCRPAAARSRSASAATGAPAPTSPSCSIVPWTRRPSACPRRALGLRWLAVDQAPRMLNVTLEAPEKVKSGAMLTVPVKVDRAGPGRGGAHHGCRHRPRHPQPDALRDAQAAGLVLRPAPARHRDPRRLRPPDRRHARRARHAALGRRRQRQRHGHEGQPAGRGDARAVLRHRQGRPRRHRPGRVPDARLQRHRAAHGRGLEPQTSSAPPART